MAKYNIVEDGVTQSMINNFRECPTKAALRQLGLRAPGSQSQAIAFGHIYHHAQEITLEAIRDCLEQEDLNSEYFDQLFDEIEARMNSSMLTAEEVENLEMSLLLARATIYQYFDEWQHIYFGEDRLEIVELEKEFMIPDFFGNVPYRGKIDGILKDQQGNFWILEHKTKSNWDEDALLSIIPRELQVGLYGMAIEHLYGVLPKGVIYNVTRRPQLRYAKTKETYDKFYARVDKDIKDRRDFYFKKYEIAMNPEQFDNIYEQAFKTVKRMVEASLFRGKPSYSVSNKGTVESVFKKGLEQFSGSCTTVYGACEYINVCASRGTNIGSLMVQEKTFSELDATNQA